MVGLYYGGNIMAILMALLMRKTLFEGEAVPFVMELPNYRMPGMKNVSHLLWEKAKDFLQRAFTVIFIATIIIWFLQTFNLSFNVVENSQETRIYGKCDRIFSQYLNHLDLVTISTALISGFMAKESVCATLSVLSEQQKIF